MLSVVYNQRFTIFSVFCPLPDEGRGKALKNMEERF